MNKKIKENKLTTVDLLEVLKNKIGSELILFRKSSIDIYKYQQEIKKLQDEIINSQMINSFTLVELLSSALKFFIDFENDINIVGKTDDNLNDLIFENKKIINININELKNKEILTDKNKSDLEVSLGIILESLSKIKNLINYKTMVEELNIDIPSFKEDVLEKPYVSVMIGNEFNNPIGQPGFNTLTFKNKNSMSNKHSNDLIKISVYDPKNIDINCFNQTFYIDERMLIALCNLNGINETIFLDEKPKVLKVNDTLFDKAIYRSKNIITKQTDENDKTTDLKTITEGFVGVQTYKNKQDTKNEDYIFIKNIIRTYDENLTELFSVNKLNTEINITLKAFNELKKQINVLMRNLKGSVLQ